MRTRETDRDLPDARAASAGDLEAFERIYRRHLDAVHRLARLMLSTDDVDDAVQEVFVRVWLRIGSFRGEARLGTWIHRLATNVLLRYRQRSRTHSAPLAPLEQAATRRAVTPRPDLRADMERAVRTLPDGAREVFVLHDVEGWTHREIAEVLGVTPSTSRSQLHRARSLLRARLDLEGRSPEGGSNE